MLISKISIVTSTYVFVFVVINLIKYYFAKNKANFIDWLIVILINRQNKRNLKKLERIEKYLYFITKNKYKIDYNGIDILRDVWKIWLCSI